MTARHHPPTGLALAEPAGRLPPVVQSAGAFRLNSAAAECWIARSSRAMTASWRNAPVLLPSLRAKRSNPESRAKARLLRFARNDALISRLLANAGEDDLVSALAMPRLVLRSASSRVSKDEASWFETPRQRAAPHHEGIRSVTLHPRHLIGV